MYKCLNCGEIFEEAKPIKEDWGESFSVCPYCNGDYEEAKQCQECGEWHAENEMYDGWCEKCLRETINYDTFFDYCMANDDENYLEIFVLSEFMGGMDCPKWISYDFHQLMIFEYKHRAELVCSYERMFGKKAPDDFLSACIRFIMDDDGSVGRENYADWLNKREVK